MRWLISVLLALLVAAPLYAATPKTNGTVAAKVQGLDGKVQGVVGASPEYAYNITTSPNAGYTIYNVTDTIGQTFVAAEGGDLTELTVNVYAVNGTSGVLSARIGTTCDVSSSYVAAATNTITLTSTGDKTFTFSSGSLTQGNTYCIVLRNADALWANRVDIGHYNSMSEGSQAYSSGALYSGDNWVATTATTYYRDLTGSLTVMP